MIATIKNGNGGLKITFRTFMAGIVIAGGITDSHFTGLSDAKEYTDKGVDEAKAITRTADKEIQANQLAMKVQLAKIEQILVERLPKPRRGRHD